MCPRRDTSRRVAIWHAKIPNIFPATTSVFCFQFLRNNPLKKECDLRHWSSYFISRLDINLDLCIYLAFSTSYFNEYSSVCCHLAKNRSHDDTQQFPNSLLSRELPLLFVSVYWKPSPVMIRDTKGKSSYYRSEISLRKAPLGAFLSTMSFEAPYHPNPHQIPGWRRLTITTLVVMVAASHIILWCRVLVLKSNGLCEVKRWGVAAKSRKKRSYQKLYRDSQGEKRCTLTKSDGKPFGGKPCWEKRSNCQYFKV